MTRHAGVLRLRREHEAEYRRLHAAPPRAVLDGLRRAHIRNFSIHLRDGWLFSYFEYDGHDFAEDMRALQDDPAMRDWEALCASMQMPVPGARAGEWWAEMEEVFHLG